jgi:hypothetical protein
MLKKFILSLTAVMALSLVAIAQDSKATTLEGYIVDKHCSAGDVGNHGKGCVLSADCVKSGLGVYSDGKFIAFDAHGTAEAKAALEKSKKDKSAKFKVTGKLSGDKMSVEKIEEVL